MSAERDAFEAMKKLEDKILADLMKAYNNHPLWTPPEKPEPESTADVPVISGSVIGYRAWRIHDWQLCGTGVNRHWHPGVNEATCDTGESAYGFVLGPPRTHPAPSLGCHCGITALARFAESDSHWSMADVYGAIEAWSDDTFVGPGDVADATGVEVKGEHDAAGRFILHGTGFRAQYGKIVLLAIDDDWPTAKKAAVRALAGEHGADLCKRSHLEDAAKEHGQLVSDEMLAWANEADPEPVQTSGYFISSAWGQQYYSSYANPGSLLYSPMVVQSKPKRRERPRLKGVKRTLKTFGPPPLGKHRVGDRVRDRAGDVWRCVAGGSPGTWEAEAA